MVQFTATLIEIASFVILSAVGLSVGILICDRLTALFKGPVGNGRALQSGLSGELQADGCRALTSDECSLVERLFDQFSDYADSKTVEMEVADSNEEWGMNVLGAILLGVSVGLVLGFAWLVFAEERGPAMDLFERARTGDLEWYLYLDGIGAGDVLAIVTLMIALWTLLFVPCWIWPYIGAMGILGYRRAQGKPGDPWACYRQFIVCDVRLGHITERSHFEPEEYVINDFRKVARFWFVLTPVWVVINLAVILLDRMNYDLLTEDYIESSDYWTLKVRRMAYGDVDRVEVVCASYADNNDDSLEMSYHLQFGDQRIIRVIDLDKPREFRTVLRKRLHPWTKIDTRLRAADVPVHQLVRTDDDRTRSRFVDSECRTGLDALVGVAVRERVMPLLSANGRSASRSVEGEGMHLSVHPYEGR